METWAFTAGALNAIWYLPSTLGTWGSLPLLQGNAQWCLDGGADAWPLPRGAPN